MAKNLGQVKAIHVGTTAPTNTNMLWRDTSITPKTYKEYIDSSGTWEPLVSATHKYKNITPAAGIAAIDCESLETVIATIDTVMTANHNITKSNDTNLKHCFIDGECIGTVVLDFSAFSGVVCAEASGNLWTWDNTNKEITFDAATATPFEASIKKAKTGWILRFSAIVPV